MLFVFSILSIVDIPFSSAYSFPTGFAYIYLVTVAAFKATLLIFLIAFLDRKKWVIPIIYILVGLYGLLAFLNFFSKIFYGFGITRKLLVIISQTNLDEIKGFVPGFWNNIGISLSNTWTIIIIVIFILLIIFIRFTKENIFTRAVFLVSSCGLLILSLFSLRFSYGRTANFIALRLPKYVYETYRGKEELDSLLSKRIEFPFPESVSSSRLAKNIILVIGESSSKEHNSIYEYPLNTNPYTSAMSDSLYIFQNAIGSSSSTAGNLERILTFKEDDNTFNDWYKFPLILNLFSHAGYTTYYISNQERTGLLSNSSGAIAESADIIKYVGAENSEDVLASRYDEIVLPVYRQYLHDKKDQDKFFIIHLMGSHTKYKNRYPEQYSRFKAQDILRHTKEKPWIDEKRAKIIAEYDNSIVYTDYILKEIIDELKVISNSSILIYLSDHGEHLFDYRDFIGRDPKMVRVPFIIYLNRAYQESNQETLQRFDSTVLYRPFSTANVVYPLMTLSGTKYPKFYNAYKDVLSPQFKQTERYVDEEIWKFDRQ